MGPSGVNATLVDSENSSSLSDGTNESLMISFVCEEDTESSLCVNKEEVMYHLKYVCVDR